MANWTITVDIDCGDDEETESVVDDMVWAGVNTILTNMRNLELTGSPITITDPHGNVDKPTLEATL